MTPANKLQEAIRRAWTEAQSRGWDKTYFAVSVLGLESMQVLTNWLSRGMPGSELERVADGLGWTVDQLLGRAPLPDKPNTSPGPDIKGRVPLISWVQAGDWAGVVDNFHPGDADEWIETTVPVRQHTYALRVKGDSMTNPSGSPSFPHGIIIIVEPEVEAVPGAYVVVRQNGDEECTFKQLVKDAGTLYLKPLNPAYPLLRMSDDAVICGVVREATMRFF